MKQEEWESYKKRSKRWRIFLRFELLHSQAFKDLNYAPALKVLCWIFEKLRLEVDKRKHGEKRYRVVNDKFSFTYTEAKLRGLSHKQFSKSLKLLHEFGFLDIVKKGSGLMGDFTIFKFSERWRQYSTDSFVKMEFPRSVPYGFRKFQRYKKDVDQRLEFAVENDSQRSILDVVNRNF